jgi:hypothetical protein
MKFEYSDELARDELARVAPVPVRRDNKWIAAVREEIPLAKDAAGVYRIGGARDGLAISEQRQ